MTDDIRLDDYVDSLLAEPVHAPVHATPVAPSPAPVPTPVPAVTPISVAAIAAPVLSAKHLETFNQLPAHLRAVLDVAPPPPAPATVRPKRWLCFDVAGQSFAVELMKVQEVQRVPVIVPVRGAPPGILGVINLRGEILPVMDLGMHLGFPACDASGLAARVIVLEEKGKTLGLLVSTVADVATLNESDIERSESALRAFPCEALMGVARHSKTLTALLDASEFLK